MSDTLRCNEGGKTSDIAYLYLKRELKSSEHERIHPHKVMANEAWL